MATTGLVACVWRWSVRCVEDVLRWETGNRVDVERGVVWDAHAEDAPGRRVGARGGAPPSPPCAAR
ncbi:MAG: hypothetical protein ABGZ17_03510, partial [Planctomycetaceae bacterium]